MNRSHRHAAGSGCLGTMEVKSKRRAWGARAWERLGRRWSELPRGLDGAGGGWWVINLPRRCPSAHGPGRKKI
ncbi:hypothetical protein P7K49_009900 [Saguinus oedipus]|uniref:Uncharacterized protein n=1 Tax=Saguinus oedipus TaxID=9490 RepID=A0ABQ9VMP5_SAGOE|nr:hypothetical protein P7K49_009900 [Saguinus oedipus]